MVRPVSAHDRFGLVVVDDHDLLREALHRVLARYDDVDVLGLVGTVSAGLEMILEVAPDVVLIDYTLPDGTGVELAVAAMEAQPALRTVILTASGEIRAAAEAVEAGCHGFLRKTTDVDLLVDGLRRVHQGEALFDAQTLSAAMTWLHRPSQRSSVDLTKRELEVLDLLAQGRSSKEISETIYLSHHTVRNHVRNLLAKLGARSQLEAVVTGASLGLVHVGRAPTEGGG